MKTNLKERYNKFCNEHKETIERIQVYAGLSALTFGGIILGKSVGYKEGVSDTLKDVMTGKLNK